MKHDTLTRPLFLIVNRHNMVVSSIRGVTSFLAGLSCDEASKTRYILDIAEVQARSSQYPIRVVILLLILQFYKRKNHAKPASLSLEAAIGSLTSDHILRTTKMAFGNRMQLRQHFLSLKPLACFEHLSPHLTARDRPLIIAKIDLQFPRTLSTQWVVLIPCGVIENGLGAVWTLDKEYSGVRARVRSRLKPLWAKDTEGGRQIIH